MAPQGHNERKIEVAIYAAAPATGQHLAALVSGHEYFRIAGTAENLKALEQLQDGTVDVILADIAKNESPTDFFIAIRNIPVLLLADDRDLKRVRAFFNAGAVTVLPRSTVDAEIALALAATSRSLSVLPRNLLGALLGEDPAILSENGETPDSRALTPRELDVLTAMADGASNKVIARRLGISFHTVKFHVASILAKLDADSRTDAVLEAARRGLVML